MLRRGGNPKSLLPRPYHPHVNSDAPSRGVTGERIAMPKNKTHSGTAKRVKITGTGKLRRQQTRLRHRLEVKSSTVTRRQTGTVAIAPADVKRVKKLLGR